MLESDSCWSIFSLIVPCVPLDLARLTLAQTIKLTVTDFDFIETYLEHLVQGLKRTVRLPAPTATALSISSGNRSRRLAA